MDFTVLAKWGIRIATAAGLILVIVAILLSVTFSSVSVDRLVDGFATFLAVFYYYVPAGNSLFPLCLGLWALSFTILGIRYAVIGLRTLWKTSE